MAILFLSHSTKNKQDALRLERVLSEAGHTVFVDSDHEDGIAPGADWRVELFSAISACNAVVFLNSPESQGSQWCHSELTLAAHARKWIYAVNLTAEIGPHPLLADKQGIRLETTFEDSLTWLGSTLTKDFAGRNAVTRWDSTRDPYPGLRSFEAADAAVFFGRDDAVAQVIGRVDDLSITAEGNLIALIGPSGSGKSSLVKAGVVPRLVDRGEWIIIGPFEPGNYPTDRLVAAMKAASGDVNESLDPTTLRNEGLARVVARMLDADPTKRRALIVVDQIEYLTSADASDRDSFLELLDAAVTSGSQITQLLVIRQDRLEDVQRLTPLGRRITAPLAVLSIDGDGLRVAIEAPAAAARMSVDRDLTDRVIDDATDNGTTEPGRALPLVAETLRSVYEMARSAGRRTMTLADYEALGGVKGSMERYSTMAEAQLGGDAAAIGDLLARFVALEDDSRPAIGRPVSLASLRDDEERRLVGRLQDARLLTGDGESVRIVHDRLIDAWPRLANVVQNRRRELLFRNQLERQAKEWKKGDGSEFLLGSESTEQAEALVGDEANGLTEPVPEYVRSSRRQLARRRNRRTAIIGALTALSIGASLLAVVANRSSDAAKVATRVAEAGDLASRSSAADSPYDAALLAIEAQSWTEPPVPAARTAWSNAADRLGRQPLLLEALIDAGEFGSVSAAAWNDDGTVLAVAHVNDVVLYESAEFRRIGSPIRLAEVASSLAWDPRGARIAAGTVDGFVQRFDTDVDSRKEVGKRLRTGQGQTTAVAWKPDGSTIATVNSDGQTLEFDSSTGALITIPDETTTQIGSDSSSIGQADEAAVEDPAVEAAIEGTEQASHISWDADGPTVVIGSEFGYVRVNGGSEVSVSKIGTTALARSPDGPLLAVGTGSGVGNRFGGDFLTNTGNGAGTGLLYLFRYAELEPPDAGPAASGSPISTGAFSTTTVSWSPFGDIVATGNDDGTVRLFAPDSEGQAQALGDPIRTGEGFVAAVAWSANATRVATGNSDGTLSIFRSNGEPGEAVDAQAIATGSLLSSSEVLVGIDEPIAAAWDPTGNRVAVGYRDGRWSVLDANTREQVGATGTSGDGDSPTIALAWSADGARIFTVDENGALRTFNANTQRQVGEAFDLGKQGVDRAVFSPNGRRLVVSDFGVDGSAGNTRLFDVEARRLLGIPTASEQYAIAWKRDGTGFAGGDAIGKIRVFDADGRELTSARPLGYRISTLGWSADGSTIAVGATDSLRLLDVKRNRFVVAPAASGAGGLIAVDWDSASNTLSVVQLDGTMQLFDADGRALGGRVSTGSKGVNTVVWNPKAAQILTLNQDGSVRVFVASTERDVCTYLRTLMTKERMNQLVGNGTSASRCARGEVKNLPALPKLDRSVGVSP